MGCLSVTGPPATRGDPVGSSEQHTSLVDASVERTGVNLQSKWGIPKGEGEERKEGPAPAAPEKLREVPEHLHHPPRFPQALHRAGFADEAPSLLTVS